MPGARLTGLLAAAGATAFGDLPPPPDTERAKDPRHGDYASNWPLRLAGPLGRSPRAIASAIAQHLPTDPAIDRVEVAPGGHLNFRLADAWLLERVRAIGEHGPATIRAIDVKSAPVWTDTCHGELMASQATLAHPGFRLRYAWARLGSLLALAEREGLAPWAGGRLDMVDPAVRALALAIAAVDDESRFAARRGGAERLGRYALKLSEAFLTYDGKVPLLGSPLEDAPARVGLIRSARTVLTSLLTTLEVRQVTDMTTL